MTAHVLNFNNLTYTEIWKISKNSNIPMFYRGKRRSKGNLLKSLDLQTRVKYLGLPLDFEGKSFSDTKLIRMVDYFENRPDSHNFTKNFLKEFPCSDSRWAIIFC